MENEINKELLSALNKFNNLYEKDVRNYSLTSLFELAEQGKLLAEPKVIRVYLDTAKTDDFYSISGNYFYLINSNEASNWVNVKFNRQENDNIKFEKGFGLRRPFTKFWLSYDAQAGGWVDIMIGQISPQLLEVIDNRTALIQQTTLEQIRDRINTLATPTLSNLLRALNGDTGTQINKNGAANGATTVLHTVTNGKTFYLCSFSFTIKNDDVPATCKLFITDNSDVEQYILESITPRGLYPYFLSQSFIQPRKIPAGYKVKLSTGASTCYTWASIHGWEE